MALGTLEDDFAPAIEELNEASSVPNDFKDKLNNFQREIRGPTSSVIAITAVAIMIEAAIICTRFHNIEFVNANIKIPLRVVSLL